MLLLLVYCILGNNSTCPSGTRHKPFGALRGSPRSQLCIYCTQLMYIFNVVIKIKFYSILFTAIAESTNHTTQPACDSPKMELSPPHPEPVVCVSAVTVACSNNPLPGVFHCQVCSREFDSLARFMDHRNDGCVSSENGTCFSLCWINKSESRGYMLPL